MHSGRDIVDLVEYCIMLYVSCFERVGLEVKYHVVNYVAQCVLHLLIHFILLIRLQ